MKVPLSEVGAGLALKAPELGPARRVRVGGHERAGRGPADRSRGGGWLDPQGQTASRRDLMFA